VILYQNVVLDRLGRNVVINVLPLAKMVSAIIRKAIVLVEARLVIKDICVKEVNFQKLHDYVDSMTVYNKYKGTLHFFVHLRLLKIVCLKLLNFF
jgi:hypothetical protein